MCEAQRSTFTRGRAIARAAARVLSGNWSLYEDRPGKRAWITSGPLGSEIAFDLEFGRAPRVTMVYTRSYESFGEVEVSMGSSSASFRASGTHRERNTQSSLLVMNVAQASNEGHVGGVLGFGVAPFSNATLRLKYVSTPPLKFRVSYVSSC